MKTASLPKIYLIAAVLLSVWLVSACSPSTPVKVPPTMEVLLPTITATPNPTASAAPTKTPVPTHPPAKATRKPTVTPAPKNTNDTPADDGAFTWAKGLEIHLSKERFTGWEWSPVRDEIVGFLPIQDYRKEKDRVLLRYAAPDFQAREIRAAAPASPGPNVSPGDPCASSNMIWSVDGQRIFFSGPVVNPTVRRMEPCSLWVVEHDGSNPRLYHPEQTGRWLTPLGWVGDHTLVLAGYREGVRLFDLLTGKVVSWAYSHAYGIYLFTRDYFVDAYGDSLVHDMYALAPRDEPIYMVQRDEFDAMRYARKPPQDYQHDCPGHNLLYDALPSTNTVLGYCFSEGFDDRDPKNAHLVAAHKLLLWDIDQNILITLVPYGFWGKFSPNGRVLAYLTSGQAFLDTNGKPVDPERANLEVPYTIELQNTFLQLLDLHTGAVSLSVPVVSLWDKESESFIHAGVNFSPDGRYLSFLTDREVAMDDQGWPRMVQSPSEASENGNHLYVLDLKARKIILDESGFSRVLAVPEYETTLQHLLAQWSPKSDQFIYLNSQNTLILFNLKTGSQTPLGENISGAPILIQWSASGNYVAFDVPNSDQTAFVKIP